MNTSLTEARLPYISVRRPDGVNLRPALLRRGSGRLSLGRTALALGLFLVALPTAIAAVYYTLLASPLFMSESRFAVRSAIESATIDVGIDVSGQDGGKPLGGLGVGSMGGLGGLAGGVSGAGSTSLQDPFVVSSFLMSPGLTRRLDQDGWLREKFTQPTIDRWSRLANDASQEDLFAYWRRHVTAAVDRRSNTIQLRVRAYSAETAQAIAQRAVAHAEEMIAELTQRQRDDTLALARTELAEAEARYEASGIELRQLRRTTQIVDPVEEAKAAGATLLRLMRERIRARTELETLDRLAGAKAPGRTEIEATVSGLDAQISEANQRLTGDVGSRSVLEAVIALEALELERRFAQARLNVATSVFDRARREAEHRASFLLIYLEPTLPTDTREPNVPVSIAFVAALAALAWLFSVTAIAIALDQLD